MSGDDPALSPGQAAALPRASASARKYQCALLYAQGLPLSFYRSFRTTRSFVVSSRKWKNRPVFISSGWRKGEERRVVPGVPSFCREVLLPSPRRSTESGSSRYFLYSWTAVSRQDLVFWPSPSTFLAGRYQYTFIHRDPADGYS